MAVEQFANNALTSLAAGIGAGDTSISVASAALFPTTPQFRILVDSEIMLVTGVSGTTYTVSRGQEGTVATSHAISATVALVLTVAALKRFTQNQVVQSINRTSAISNPTGLTFGSPKARIRYLELIAPALKILSDKFEADWGYYPNLQGSGITRTYGANGLVISGANNFNQQWTSTGIFKGTHLACVLEVLTEGAGTTFNDVFCSLAKGTGTNQQILAVFDTLSNVAFIQLLAGGAIQNQVSVDIGPAPFKIALVINKDNAQAWYQKSSGGQYLGWQFATNYNFGATIDLRSPSELAQWGAGFGCISGSSTSWTFGSFEAGYFGGIGLRDPCIVVHKDGTPYQKDGEYYFGLTCAGYGPGHQGIFAFNPKTLSLRKTGAIFVKRGTPLIYEDHVGTLVYDDDLKAWRIFLSTWGNAVPGVGPLAIEYQLYYGNPLHGVTVLDNMANLSLSQHTGIRGVYDPSVMYDEAAGLWRIAYTVVPDFDPAITDYYPALDNTSDFVSFSNDFAASGTPNQEGSRLIKLGGTFYVCSGGSSNMKAWSTSGTNLGNLSITLPTVTANPPWAAIFPVMDNGKTCFRILTFDNVLGLVPSNFSLANLLWYEATETETGFEFDHYN